MATETVLITGASAGIGVELAKRFAADGANLILVARRQDALDTLATELGATSSGTIRVLPKDLSAPSAPQEIFDTLSGEGVAVDVVVNNAGFGDLCPVAEQDAQRQADMIQVNVAALTRLTRLFLPGMLARRRGGILNIASTAAFLPGPNMSVYYATKAYVLFFTEGLAEELRGTGVSATAFCPGPTHTEFSATAKMENTLMFKFGAASAARVARSGHRAFRKGRVVAIAGFVNWLTAQSVRLGPRAFPPKIVKMLQSWEAIKL